MGQAIGPGNAPGSPRLSAPGSRLNSWQRNERPWGIGGSRRSTNATSPPQSGLSLTPKTFVAPSPTKSNPSSPGPSNSFCVGLDLGQAQDPTALAVLERVAERDLLGRTVAAYDLRHLERFQLGTGYPEVIERVLALFAEEPLAGQTLAVDHTGVGAVVVDMLRKAKPKARILPITITAGSNVTRGEKGDFRVPKKDLVGALQVLLQQGRLRVAADMPEAAILVKELQNFQVRITAHANEQYAAWREGLHDDLVLAAAIAAWAAEKPKANYAGLIRGVRGPSDDDD